MSQNYKLQSEVAMVSRLSSLFNLLIVSMLLGLGLSNSGVVMASANGAGTPDHIIYVDADASGTDDGQSWADAYTDLQAALSEARGLAPTENIHIWVANGVYRPTDGLAPPIDPALSFEIGRASCRERV